MPREAGHAGVRREWHWRQEKGTPRRSSRPGCRRARTDELTFKLLVAGACLVQLVLKPDDPLPEPFRHGPEGGGRLVHAAPGRGRDNRGGLPLLRRVRRVGSCRRAVLDRLRKRRKPGYGAVHAMVSPVLP